MVADNQVFETFFNGRNGHLFNRITPVAPVTVTVNDALYIAGLHCIRQHCSGCDVYNSGRFPGKSGNIGYSCLHKNQPIILFFTKVL